MGWYHYDETPLQRGLGNLDGQKVIADWDPKALAPLVQTVEVPEGHEGTVATLGIMSELARKAAQDPQFVMIAQEIVRGVPSKDYEGEARRIFDYVDRNIKFRNDPRQLEFISAPYYLLMVRGEEDCESIACLITALGMSVNLKAGYVTYKADKSRPDEWSHVVAALGWDSPAGSKWALMDTTYMGAGRGFGWAPPPSKYWDTKFWPVAT